MRAASSCPRPERESNDPRSRIACSFTRIISSIAAFVGPSVRLPFVILASFEYTVRASGGTEVS